MSKSSSNLAQSASGSAVSKKLEAPGLSVKDVTSRSVTLQWTPPQPQGELTSYVIEKRLVESETSSWEMVNTVGNTVLEYTVENLKEKAEYLFRVAAENEAGPGEAAVTQPVGLKTHARKLR